MSTSRSFTLLTIPLLFAVGIWMPSERAEAFELLLPKVETKPGETVFGAVMIKDVSDLGALQLDIAFDPGVVSVTSVEASDLLPNAMVEFNVEGGSCRVALASSDPVSGSGKLLTMTFAAVGPGGGESPLTGSNAQAWTSQENTPLDVAVLEGAVAVAGPSFSWRTLALAEGTAILCLLILGVWLARRHGARIAGRCVHCGVRLHPFMRYCYGCGKETKDSLNQKP